MTMTWALNPATNDLVIKNGEFLRVYGAQEVRQRIMVTLGHLWQEYFLNVPAGVPWYELILGSKDLNTSEAILRQIVFSVPGVVSIIDFKMSMVNRRISTAIRVEVEGDNGTDILDIIYPTGASSVP